MFKKFKTIQKRCSIKNQNRQKQLNTLKKLNCFFLLNNKHSH